MLYLGSRVVIELKFDFDFNLSVRAKKQPRHVLTDTYGISVAGQPAEGKGHYMSIFNTPS